MQTITIQANESFLNEIKELITQKAKALNEKVFINQDYKSKFDEYEADIEAYYTSGLKTLTMDEMKAKISKW